MPSDDPRPGADSPGALPGPRREGPRARGAARLLRGVGWAHRYERAWLRDDLLAGVVLTAVLVPQGLAYAELATLPPTTGLYATVFALAAYALLGPSPTLVLGPDSSLAPLIAAALVPLVGVAGDVDRRVALAGLLAIMIGVLCLVAGAARLGVVADLLSFPVRIGFLNGVAAVIVASQLPKLFGFTVDADGFVRRLRAFGQGVADGDTNATALALGLSCLVLILVLRQLAPRVPGVLIAVVGATVSVHIFDLTTHGVAVVGSVPAGFEAPALSSLRFGDVSDLLLPALGIAFVTLADTTALSRTFARGRHSEPNREMAALGAANVAAGVFHGFAVSASASRTSVAVSSGARTQLAGLTAAIGVSVLVVAGTGAVRELPSAALAAVVIAAAITIFDGASWRRLAAVRPSELVLSLVAFLGVLLVGVLEGIAVAAALSLVEFVRRAWRPYNVVLGRVEGRKGYHDIERHPDAEQIPQLVLYRFDAPLFFANAGYFAARLDEIVAERGEPVRTVVVAAEPITDVDATAADVLREVIDELHSKDIALVLAELKGPVKDRLRAYGLYGLLGDDAFPPTLGTAIDLHVERTGVEWVDWEDRVP